MMAFGGGKGELVVVIGCGIKGLDRVKLASDVMRIRDKMRCFREQD